MVEGPGLQAVGDCVGSGQQLGHGHAGEKVAPAEEHAHVGTVELVGGTGQEVAPELRHVHEGVRRVVDGVDEDEGALGVGERAHGPHVVDGADGVGGGADGQELRARAEGAMEVVFVEAAFGGKEADALHRDAAIALEGAPGIHVRVMVELGHHDLVARSPVAAEGAREVEGERRHVGAKYDLGGGGAQVVGHGLAGRQDRRVGLVARGVVPVGVGVVMEEIVRHRVHHRLRYLGAARSVEVRDLVSMVTAREGGKGRADPGHPKDVGAGDRGRSHGRKST